METLDPQEAVELFDQYRGHREGVRTNPKLGSVCLICGSTHIFPKDGDPHLFYCRSCGFAFYRYSCPACGDTIDGRDPLNPAAGSAT
jgi:rubrerythrin